jgi:small-conductance mechanosensitive channel
VSNVISGLFLIAEKPFEVGDIVQVGETAGRVLSIDTLSVKLRTFDNRFVRIPNETIVKSQVTTVTRFPIRRVELDVGVAYKEDVARVREVLLDVVERNSRALMEPAPMVLFDAYGDSALELKLRVWATKENFIALKNALLEEVMMATGGNPFLVEEAIGAWVEEGLLEHAGTPGRGAARRTPRTHRRPRPVRRRTRPVRSRPDET